MKECDLAKCIIVDFFVKAKACISFIFSLFEMNVAVWGKFVEISLYI